MHMGKIENLYKIRLVEQNLSRTELQYWLHYSGFNTWQFWVNILMLVIPLIVLFFAIDRKKYIFWGFMV